MPDVRDATFAGGHHPRPGGRDQIHAAMQLLVAFHAPDAVLRGDAVEPAHVDGEEEPGLAVGGGLGRGFRRRRARQRSLSLRQEEHEQGEEERGAHGGLTKNPGEVDPSLTST